MINISKYLVLSLLVTLLFSACSTKEVYEPKSLEKEWTHYESSDETIIDTTANIALLEDSKVLTEDGITDFNISKGDRIISLSEGWIISASIDGNITLTNENDTSITKNFDLKKTIAGASLKDNILALVFADNEIALYDIDADSFLFKEQGSKFVAVDSRIVNPLFMRGIVLFPTLDGKVIFVNIAMKKRLRTVIVSSEDTFNNVISLSLVDNKIIAATSYKILAMAKKEIRVKYEIRNILPEDKAIFIATKQGEILSLTPTLQINSKIKFPFAHFYAMTSDDENLYVLEREGYMIVIDKESFEYTVHEVDFDGGFVFVAGKTFYIDDNKILTR